MEKKAPTLFASVEKAAENLKVSPEGRYLPMMLSAAVPLWQHQFSTLSADERQVIIRDISGDDFCLRMEYVLHRGPKEGDTARAFNDLAKAIALLSFFPGGVTCFDSHWEAMGSNAPPKAPASCLLRSTGKTAPKDRPARISRQAQR